MLLQATQWEQRLCETFLISRYWNTHADICNSNGLHTSKSDATEHITVDYYDAAGNRDRQHVYWLESAWLTRIKGFLIGWKRLLPRSDRDCDQSHSLLLLNHRKMNVPTCSIFQWLRTTIKSPCGQKPPPPSLFIHLWNPEASRSSAKQV